MEREKSCRKGIVIGAIAGTPQGDTDTRLTHTDGTTRMNIVWAIGDAFTVYNGSEKHNYTLTGGVAVLLRHPYTVRYVTRTRPCMTPVHGKLCHPYSSVYDTRTRTSTPPIHGKVLLLLRFTSSCLS